MSKNTITDREKRIAWEKADLVPGKDLHVWRMDEEGNLIRFASYQKTFGHYGWDVALAGKEKGCCDNTCRLKAVGKRTD